MTPVSICMALTVALVRILNPEGESGPNTVAIATIYYNEKVRLSALEPVLLPTHKLQGTDSQCEKYRFKMLHTWCRTTTLPAQGLPVPSSMPASLCSSSPH